MKPIWIIAGMMMVTYIPRWLPGLLKERYPIPPGFQKWLQNIPYAALGALILPGILKSDDPLTGVIGGITAVILSLLNMHIVIVMAGTILAAIAMQYLF